MAGAAVRTSNARIFKNKFPKQNEHDVNATALLFENLVTWYVFDL